MSHSLHSTTSAFLYPDTVITPRLSATPDHGGLICIGDGTSRIDLFIGGTENDTEAIRVLIELENAVLQLKEMLSQRIANTYNVTMQREAIVQYNSTAEVGYRLDETAGA